MSASIHRLLACLCVAASFYLGLGWETGVEYVYEYDGQITNKLGESKQSAAVRFRAQLTAQSIDENTLAIKLSEIRIKRSGSASGDEIWLPIETGEEEPVGDALHLLGPFVLIHNKGSFVSLMVESDDPAWSVNAKKAVASVLQLDVTGVRSGADGGVFGERSTTLNSLEDGVTGDCLTTVHFTRLPYHRALRQRPNGEDQVLADLCRSANVYEIVKIKDFDDCRIDPLQTCAAPGALRSTTRYSSNGEPAPQLRRTASYKYLACGESSERATIVQIDGSGLTLSTGPAGVASQQAVRVALKSRAQIHQLLPNMTRPKVLDTLVYSPDDTASSYDVKETRGKVIQLLNDAVDRLATSTKSHDDVVEKLNIVSAQLARLNAAQLGQIWQQSINSTARDLFLDCAAASGGLESANFLLELIELGEVRDIRAVSLLASAGHSIQSPNIALLQRFVRITRSELALSSSAFKATALAVAAELLHSHCIVSQLSCRFDAQIITEDFLPFIVAELENAGSSAERLTILTALGALGSEDVLLLLVPYIRGDDVSARIAAIRSLRRLMDSFPEKVVPLLSSLADNIAERPEVRMAAVDMLLFHADTPLKVWRKIAHRTWFESIQQMNRYVCNVIYALASTRSAALASASEKARQVIHLVRPCADKTGFQFYSSFASDDHGFYAKIASWRVSNSPLPAFLDAQLFYQLGSVAFNPLQLSIWNYNTENVWNAVFRRAPESRGTKLNEIWDQLSLRFEPEDDRVGLVHVKLADSALQGFFNLEHIDPLGLLACDACGTVRLAKYQQLAGLRWSVPTELGFPARFTLSLAGVISAAGSVGGRAADVAAFASAKWTSEARVLLPFNDHYAAAGFDWRAELRAPLHVALNESLTLTLPRSDTDLAYFRFAPYTVTRSANDELAAAVGAEKVHTVSGGTPSNASFSLAPNVRLEIASGAASDWSASAWFRRFAAANFTAFSLARLDYRVFRLRYLPEVPLHAIALSGAIESLHRDDAVELVSGSNDTSAPDRGNATIRRTGEESVHLVKTRIVALYSNGSTTEWTPLELDIEREDSINVTISGASADVIGSYLNALDMDFLNATANSSSRVCLRYGSNVTRDVYLPLFSIHSEQYGALDSLLHLSMFAVKRSSCQITLDSVTTYDRVEYSYKLNECHHILTADCSRRAARYAITGRNDRAHGLVVRVTLANDVIELTERGNITFNGAIVESNLTSVRIRSGEHVLALLSRTDGVHFKLLREGIHVVINESSITIHAAGQILGRACGLCGDGDGEVAGEFKTADRCALTSGSVMAAGFQITHGLDECPILSDNAFKHLQGESYPCYSIDEQVPSILPLPPESL